MFSKNVLLIVEFFVWVGELICSSIDGYFGTSDIYWNIFQ